MIDLKQYLPFINGENIKTIVDSIATEMNITTDRIHDAINQILSVDSATHKLSAYEKEFGINNSHLSDDIRRGIIKSKMLGTGTVTVQMIKDIVKNFVAEANVLEDNANYQFIVEMISNNGFSIELSSIYNRVEDIKPAHLAVLYLLISEMRGNGYTYSTMISSEEITIYPRGGL